MNNILSNKLYICRCIVVIISIAYVAIILGIDIIYSNFYINCFVIPFISLVWLVCVLGLDNYLQKHYEGYKDNLFGNIFEKID